MQRIYKQGYQAFQTVLEGQATVENLHEWRKQVKYLWYQLQIISPIWSDLIKEWVNQTHRLADYLENDHDLAVLHQFINERQHILTNQAELEIFNSLINSRRKELQLAAQSLGQRIYTESPKLFGDDPKRVARSDRMEAYWQIWEKEG